MTEFCPLQRFRRLATVVRKILKVFKPITYGYVHEEHCGDVSPRRRPNLEQLVLQDGRQRISERIQQRLQGGIPSSRQTQGHKCMGLSGEVKDTLCRPPWNRNTTEMERARLELQASSGFQDYPIQIQQTLCKVAWYQYLEDGRTVIRTGHQATIFCIVLSGKVTVNHCVGGTTTLSEGDTFGETELMSEERRTSTCVVSGSAELLVISKSDYLDLGLRQARKSYQKAKPYEFCRHISLLKYWPLDNLEQQPDVCKIFYCRPNHVVVKDSKKSDWIYIVLTGTCRVVKRFVDTTERRSSIQPHMNEGRKVSVKGGTLPESPLLTEQTLPPRKRTLKHSYTTGSLQTMERGQSRLPPAGGSGGMPRKQFLVQLEILHPKDIFGLSTIVHDSEPSVTLMSNGAELVVLSKTFILSHMTDSLKVKLRKQVMEYPSEEAMRKRIRDHYTWNTFKQVNQARRRL